MDIKNNNLNLLSPPGDTLEEHLLYIAVKQLADFLGWDMNKVRHLLLGNELIDDALAAKLAEYTGIEAQFWINREKNYRDNLAELELAKTKGASHINTNFDSIADGSIDQ